MWCRHCFCMGAFPFRNREGFGWWVPSQTFEGHSETSSAVQARFLSSQHLPGFLTLSAALRYSYLATNMSATDILEKNKWDKSEFDALPLKSRIQFARWQEWECDLMWTVGHVIQREAPPHHRSLSLTTELSLSWGPRSSSPAAHLPVYSPSLFLSHP